VIRPSFYEWLMRFHRDKREMIQRAMFAHAAEWPYKDLTTILREGVGEELFTAYRAYQRITTGEK
jgi:hypothetical protein